MSQMFSEDKFETIQDDLLRIELQKKFGGKCHFFRKSMCHYVTSSLTSSGPQEPSSSLSSSSAFSTLKRLITNKSSVPAVARQLSTFLPALLPGLARSHQPILPWLPPLEVELTEDPDPGLDLASSSPDPGDHSSMSSADPALSITVSPDPCLDQIPSTINSLSPRSNRNSQYQAII